MIYELVDAVFDLTSIYMYHTEGHPVKRKKSEKGIDCINSLTSASKNLRKFKEASAIVEALDSWKKKLVKKYSTGEVLDEADANKLSQESWDWLQKLDSIAQELDKEQKTLESIEERMKKVEMGFEPTLQKIDDYMSKIQGATLTFVESSPTERFLEPTLRGLLNRTNSGELVLTGYFDQYLLRDFQSLSPKPSIKFISPELTNSKQDKINLDALKRLQKVGAEVRVHPMLHARMFLSPTEIIVGSADIKSDCLGGRRYDAGIWSNNPVLVRSGKAFVDKVWIEAKPLS